MRARSTIGILAGGGLLLSGVMSMAQLPAASAPGVADRVSLRDSARLVLEARCGQCHIGAYPTAIPGALRIFDLGEAEFAARMTEPQMRDVVGRLRDPQGMDESVTGPADPADVRAVEHYFDTELAARAVSP